jgi:hypothetical protein
MASLSLLFVYTMLHMQLTININSPVHEKVLVEIVT